MGALRHLGQLIESEIQGELAKIDWGKFKVQLIAQDEGKELGRDASGGLPVRVVGHEKMGKAAYEAWALPERAPPVAELHPPVDTRHAASSG